MTTALRAIAAAAWIVAVVTTGDQLDIALDTATTGARWVVRLGAWALWAATAGSLAIRHPVALTVARLGSLTGTAAAFVAVAANEPSAATLTGALVAPLVTTMAMSTRSVGEAWIDGASYGDEHRFMLRAPLGLMLGPIPLAVIATVAGTIVGPALLASGRTAAGWVALVIGLPVAIVAARAIHGLHRRWLVFVPAGVVVHDLMTTREPFLMIHGQIADVAAAPASMDVRADHVHDGTAHAPGLVLVIDLDSPVELVRRPVGGALAEAVTRRQIAIVATRPVAVVEEFRARRSRRAVR